MTTATDATTTSTDTTTASLGDEIVGAATLLDGGAAAASEGGEAATGDAAAAAAAEGEGGDKGKAAEGAPEKYEITLADGQAFDTEAMEVVEPILRELGLTNDQAGKLAAAWPGLQEKMAARFAAAAQEQQVTELNNWSAEWERASVADAEIGGAPEVMGPKMALAAKARDQFASPELRNLLRVTRLGNHPEVLRLFWKVGAAISEGTFVRGDGGGPQTQPTADVLWPNMKAAS